VSESAVAQPTAALQAASPPLPPQASERPNRASSVSEQRETVLRQQQQRLLLLRHASRCLAKPGACPATAHCGQMKDLWKHIAKCKATDCQTPHCVSSRYVLSHYHKCHEPMCDVCKPVRDAINRHQNRAKDSKEPAEAPHGEGAYMFPDKPAMQPPPAPPPSSSTSQQQQPPASAVASAAAASPSVAPARVAAATAVPSDTLVNLAQRYLMYVHANQKRQQRIQEKEQMLVAMRNTVEQRKAELAPIEQKFRLIAPKVAKKEPKQLPTSPSPPDVLQQQQPASADGGGGGGGTGGGAAVRGRARGGAARGDAGHV